MKQRKIFFKKESESHIAEALRLLRTNIHFLEPKKKRVILCTSTVPGEGKSFITANYAMSVAISGEKVLLIDCDIRRPRAHTIFNLKVQTGITDILLGEKKAEECLRGSDHTFSLSFLRDFVCGYGMITKKELLQAKKMLSKAEANLYGIVINKIEESGYSTGNYGYYTYTHKYYDEYMNEKN